MPLASNLQIDNIFFALDGACADLGITKANSDLRLRQRMLHFIADLVLAGELDAGMLRKRAVECFGQHRAHGTHA